MIVSIFPRFKMPQKYLFWKIDVSTGESYLKNDFFLLESLFEASGIKCTFIWLFLVTEFKRKKRVSDVGEIFATEDSILQFKEAIKPCGLVTNSESSLPSSLRKHRRRKSIKTKFFTKELFKVLTVVYCCAMFFGFVKSLQGIRIERLEKSHSSVEGI